MFIMLQFKYGKFMARIIDMKWKPIIICLMIYVIIFFDVIICSYILYRPEKIVEGKDDTLLCVNNVLYDTSDFLGLWEGLKLMVMLKPSDI